VVDGDPAGAQIAGEASGEACDRRLGHGVGAAAREGPVVGVDAADGDDAPALGHVAGRLGAIGADGEASTPGHPDGHHHLVGLRGRARVGDGDGGALVSRFAVAASMPHDPPVTRATFPARVFSMDGSLGSLCCWKV